MAVNDEMFKTTLMGGYDKEEVQRFIQKMKEENYAEKSKLLLSVKARDKKLLELNDSIKEKDQEIDRLKHEIKEKYQSYIDNYETIGQLVYDARIRSDRMVAEAKEEADRIVKEAEETAKKCLDSVQADIDEKLSEGKKKYIAVQEELNDIVELVNQVQRRFMQSYKSVHTIINTMPESLQELEGQEVEEELLEEPISLNDLDLDALSRQISELPDPLADFDDLDEALDEGLDEADSEEDMDIKIKTSWDED